MDDLCIYFLPSYPTRPLYEATEIADYRPYLIDSTYIGTWSGTISMDSLSIPLSLKFGKDGVVTANYIDYTYSSYFTQNAPLPNKEDLLMALTNDNSFIGLFLGELPNEKMRSEHSHLLSLKLLKSGNELNGTIVALAAAEREYYAYPFHVNLVKETDNK